MLYFAGDALVVILLFFALLIEPTTGTLLQQAQRAFGAGNRIEAQRKLEEADVSQKKDDDALRQRLAAHMDWDNCIKSEAVRVAALKEPLNTLAEAVLGMCSNQENQTQLYASEVARRLEGLSGAQLRDDVETTMQGWRQTQKQTALAIIAQSRLAR